MCLQSILQGVLEDIFYSWMENKWIWTPGMTLLTIKEALCKTLILWMHWKRAIAYVSPGRPPRSFWDILDSWMKCWLMIAFKHSRVLMSDHWCSWVFMVPWLHVHACSWLLMDFHEHSWELMSTNEQPLEPMSMWLRCRENPWAFMSMGPWHHEYSWVL